MKNILLVDDDPSVLRAMSRTLAASFTVHTAPSAKAALELVSTGVAFDAIVSDMRMPGMDGAAFHDSLTKLAPRLAEKMIFLSGGGLTGHLADFSKAHVVITKPVLRANLVAALHAAA